MMNAKPQLGTQGALQLLAIQCIGSISIKYCEYCISALLPFWLREYKKH